MLDAVRRFFGGHEPKAGFEESGVFSAVERLNIQVAKAVHENWQHRLQSYLDGQSTEPLSAEVICLDDRCELGKWMHGPGKAQLGRFPGFTALHGHHKMFHYAASNVVALAKAGKAADAKAMLKGQFAKFSRELLVDLDLLNEVGSAHRKDGGSKP